MVIEVKVMSTSTARQEHLADLQAQVEHLEDPFVRRDVRPDGPQQFDGRWPAVQDVACLAAQGIAQPTIEPDHAADSRIAHLLEIALKYHRNYRVRAW
jgi:hypothetical protein